MEIELWQLNNIIRAAAKEAVEQFILHQNPSTDEINERQAFREFGEGWVKNMLAIGALEPPLRKGTSRNSPKVYSRSQLKKLRYGADPLLQAVVVK